MPACLHQSMEISEKDAQSMGWGATSFGGQQSDELLWGSLDLINVSDCEQQYSEDTDELPNGIVSSQICAGDPTKTRDTW